MEKNNKYEIGMNAHCPTITENVENIDGVQMHFKDCQVTINITNKGKESA